MMKRKILIVDDNQINRRILKKTLSRDYDTYEVTCGEDALDFLARNKEEQVSAVLLDISMPGISGYEVLRRIRDDSVLSRTPVIMITGSEDDDSRVKSLSLGANDFVMKPYNPDVIIHCLETNIALHESATTIQALTRDKLTGLYNREPFFKRVSEMIASREPDYYILACFDVDGFKIINDQYGMEKGDEVLRHIANVFTEGFEPNGGVCCRISADNFAVLYPASFKESPELESIRNRATHVEGLAVPIIFSIGRYLVSDIALPANTMYDRANIACESVKKRYDNKIAFYNASMMEKLMQKQEIVLEMKPALEKHQFEVWYQPQYNHSTGAMIGAEALVRWRHPEKGLISPGVFIPLFEENGFIYNLDRYVWEEVCRNLRRWIDEGKTPLPVSVNISRYDILRPGLVEVILGITQKYNIPVDMLRLEITESAFSESAGQIIDVVKKFIDNGFTVEIDDFGSGYSSLNTLKDVPAQILKLDMKFLERTCDSGRGGNIVESVVRMAKWLGMSVIAEGVETPKQADYLRSVGCSYIQGFLFARPMPLSDYEEHCANADKEEHLLKLETVENLNNNSFWDPDSMDTLIFNSYVGGACIYEYYNGNIELLRATRKYGEVIGSAGMTIEEALKLNWTEHLDEEYSAKLLVDLEKSIKTKDEVTGEYIFLDLPGCPHETYLRSTLRVIASAGDRYLVYCTNENITAQRQSEKKSRELADRLQAIMDNVDLGIIAAVVEGESAKYVFANDRYYSMLGYTKEQFEAEIHSPYDTVAADDRMRIQELTSKLNEDGGSAVLEYYGVMRDGKQRFLRAAVKMGRLSGVDAPVQLSILRDVTEEKAAELREKKAGEQITAIMRDIDSGLTATIRNNGKVELLFSNEQYYRMRGYTKEEYRSQVTDYYDIIHPDDREHVRQTTSAVYSAGEPLRDEYRIILRDGSIRWIRINMSITRFTGVRQPVVLTVYSDITSEKAAELASADAMAQLGRMMDDMPGGFARIHIGRDGSMVPVYVNDGLCAITGMSHDEFMEMYKKDALAGVHPDDVSVVRDAVAKMRVKGEAHSVRYRLFRKPEGYVWLSIFGRLTSDLSGETYLNIYYTDATKQVADEDKQKALLDNLPGGAGIYEYRDGHIRLVYQNRCYRELVGADDDALPDATPISAVHPDDIAVVKQEIALAIANGRDASCDIRLNNPKLGYLCVHFVGRIIRNNTGIVIYATFTPAEEDGMTYQQMLPLLLSAIMESTSDLTFAKDTSFRYLSASRAFANMIGFESEKDILGKTDYELFGKELADKYRRDDAALLASGKSLIDMVENIPSEGGIPRYSSTSKYILNDSFGKPIGIYGVGRDITRSVDQETRLKLIADTIPGGLASYACKSGETSPGLMRLVYFNDGYHKLFGYTSEELADGEAPELSSAIFADDYRVFEKQWQALMENDVPMNCLYRIRTRDGGYKWLSNSAVVASRGDTVIVNAILQDVTGQRELVERLCISEEERKRFELAVDSAGICFIEYDWLKGSFVYHPSVPKCLYGKYDGRTLWMILLADMVTDTVTVQDMQNLVHLIAGDRNRNGGSMEAVMLTPDKLRHRFRVIIRKITDTRGLTSKLIITLNDTEYDAHMQ